MTRRTPWILVLVVVFAGAIATARAAEHRFFSGVVLAVAPSQRLVSVVEAGAPKTQVTFTIPRDVPIRKAGDTIDLSRVKVGDPVAIEYDTSGRRAIATSFQVLINPTP